MLGLGLGLGLGIEPVSGLGIELLFWDLDFRNVTKPTACFSMIALGVVGVYYAVL